MAQHNNQRGDAVTIVVIILIIAFTAIMIGLQVFIYVAKQNHRAEYDAWAEQCYAASGVVLSVASNRDECFIDNQKVVLPGWERYAESISQ